MGSRREKVCQRIPFFFAGVSSLYTLSLENSSITVLLPETSYVYPTCWSADGRWIYLNRSWRNGNGIQQQIYRLREDGSEFEQLTFSEGPNFPANGAVSPNGTLMAYNGQKDSISFGIWIMNLTGRKESLISITQLHNYR